MSLNVAGFMLIHKACGIYAGFPLPATSAAEWVFQSVVVAPGIILVRHPRRLVGFALAGAIRCRCRGAALYYYQINLSVKSSRDE